MAYSKLYSSIVHSSLWTAQDNVRLLFVTLLALADPQGYVYGSRSGLARAANISRKRGQRDPWEHLMAPDPDSSDLMRNPENEGRRIEEVPGGFRILNFLFYRSLRNEDDRREQNREAQARHREKVKQEHEKESSLNQPESAEVSQSKPISEAEAEAEANKKDGQIDSAPAVVNVFSDFIERLRQVPAYATLDIEDELSKMEVWCELNHKKPTRRRFVNWLNRCDKPIAGAEKKERAMSAFEITTRIKAIDDELSSRKFSTYYGEQMKPEVKERQKALIARRKELKNKLTE